MMPKDIRLKFKIHMLCMRPHSEEHWAGLASEPSKTPGPKSPQYTPAFLVEAYQHSLNSRASFSSSGRSQSSAVHSSQSTICFRGEKSTEEDPHSAPEALFVDHQQG